MPGPSRQFLFKQRCIGNLDVQHDLCRRVSSEVVLRHETIEQLLFIRLTRQSRKMIATANH